MNWLSRLMGRDRGDPAPKSLAQLITEADSPNGYLREQAVAALGSMAEHSALLVLLVRVNDWVPEVRRAARTAVEAFLDSVHVIAWVSALDQVVALGRAGRDDHSGLLGRIKTFLSQASSIRVLKASVEKPSRDVSRLLFELEFASPLDDESCFLLLREALTGDDIVAASCAMASISRVSPERQQSLLRIASSCDFGSIRATGLRAALALKVPNASVLARVLCRDKSKAVRAVALAAMKDDRADVVTEMRTELQKASGSRARAVALDVLCELGVSDALVLCRYAIADHSPAVRHVAFGQAFRLVDELERDQLVLEVLRDSASRVRRISVLQVRRGAAVPDAATLLQLLTERPESFDQLAVLARWLSPWARVSVSTTATGSPT